MVDSPDEAPDRLRLLIDRLPALIGYWDLELRNVIANDLYNEYFGLSPAEVRGRHIRAVLGEAVYSLNLPYIEGALAGKEQLFSRTLIDRYGVTRHTQTSYIPDLLNGVVQGFFVLVTDVTERVRAEAARDDAQRLVQISMDNAPFGKALFSITGEVLYVNPALCRSLGYTAAELMGNGFNRHLHPDDFAIAFADWMSILEGLRTNTISECRYLCRDGTNIWMECHTALAKGSNREDDIIIAQFQDMTERRHFQTELTRLAITDSLTGLANRVALTKHLSHQSMTHSRDTVGVLFIDLDKFKQINDVYGHTVGDAVLVEAARRLAANAEHPSSAYRVGGDEFVVVMPHVKAYSEIAALVDKIELALSGPYQPATGVLLHLSASVGGALGPANKISALIDNADEAMYYKKRLRGKKQFERNSNTETDFRLASFTPTDVGAAPLDFNTG